MNERKETMPTVTDIAWALMRKWAAAYGVPVETLNERFGWAVNLAKSYSNAPITVIKRQVGFFL